MVTQKKKVNYCHPTVLLTNTKRNLSFKKVKVEERGVDFTSPIDLRANKRTISSQ